MSRFLAILLIFLGSTLEISEIEKAQEQRKGVYEKHTQNEMFRWMGYEWEKRDNTWQKEGPGPNYFAAKNLECPRNEYDPLTMLITQEGRNFYCSEFYMNEQLGYGRYEIEIHQKVEDIANTDPRVVFGFFLYKNDEYEYDIEIAKWGIDKPNAYNMDYITQPHYEGRTGVTFLLPFGHQNTRHIMEWHPDIINWRTEDIDTGEVLYEWSTIEQVRREDPDFVLHFNWWMHEGIKPRVAPQAITIDSFKFTKY